MHFTSDKRLDDGVIEREFVLGEIPGILWTPASASAAVPLILLGHPGGLSRMYPRLVGRARRSVASGFAAATIELPGSGVRSPLPDVERARADLRRVVAVGEPVGDDIIARLALPLLDRAVPEWQAALDDLLALPEIGGPVGYSGGVIAIGVRIALVEPRIVAAGLFAGSFVPRVTFEDAGESPFRCRSSSNGMTRTTTGRWHWTCSTPSARERSHCTPTWAGTQASRGSPARTPPGSSSGT